MDKETSEITISTTRVKCVVCGWYAHVHTNAYVTPDKDVMAQLDAASQRRVDDALASHLREEHGLMSVLTHTWEMTQQADRSFREGEKVGEQKLESSLRKVVLRAMLDAVSSQVDPEDE